MKKMATTTVTATTTTVTAETVIPQDKKVEEVVKPKNTKRYFGIASTNAVFVQDADSNPEKLDLAKDVYAFTTEDIRWGMVDSRTKQLSLAILMDVLGNPNEAFEANNAFCNSFISTLKSDSDWIISEFQIRQFLRSLELREMSVRQAKGLPLKQSKEDMDNTDAAEMAAIFDTAPQVDNVRIMDNTTNPGLRNSPIIRQAAESGLIPRAKTKPMPKDNSDMTQFDADALIAMGRALSGKPDNGKKPD